MTKKHVIIISGMGIGAFLVLSSNYLQHAFCANDDNCYSLFRALKILCMLSLAIFPVSILSLMNKEGTFLLWKKFTIAFFSLYFFAILISPTEGADYIKIEKGTVGIFLSCAYLAISLVLIAYKSYQLRGK